MTIRGTDGPLASLPEILDRREARAAQQARLLAGGRCLISFCMNIPGARKAFPLASAGFAEGLRQLHRTLEPYRVTEEVRYSGITGEEAFLLLDADPWEIKKRTTALEEGHPLGRLWDMDVLDGEGRSLSRQALGLPRRTCLLCGEDAKVCGRNRRHTAEQLFQRTAELLDGYFRTAAPETGLADRDNSDQT